MENLPERSTYELLSFVSSRGGISENEWADFVTNSELNLVDYTDLQSQLINDSLLTLSSNNNNEKTINISSFGAAWLEENGSAFKVDIEEKEVVENIDSNVLYLEDPVHPYDVSKVRVVSLQMSIFQVLRKIDKKEIKLDPEFQRAFVWDDIRKSRLIESVLIRIPLPAFYIDATNEEEWEVVDGLQRLNTLYEYWKGNFKLVGLQFLKDLESSTFNQLPNRFRIQLEDNTQLLFYQLQPGTPSKAKFTIFSRLNTGGMTLTAQEIRHALFQGPVTLWLKQLAEHPKFIAATSNSIPTKRMENRETVLRAIAFMMKPYEEYKGDLDGFLSEAMDSLNKKDDKYRSDLAIKFLSSIEKVYAIFDKYAFRKMYQEGGRRSTFNKALFEAWTVSVQNYSLDHLKNNKSSIRKASIEMINEDWIFSRSISYGTGSALAVRTRFSNIERILSND